MTWHTMSGEKMDHQLAFVSCANCTGGRACSQATVTYEYTRSRGTQNTAEAAKRGLIITHFEVQQHGEYAVAEPLGSAV